MKKYTLHGLDGEHSLPLSGNPTQVIDQITNKSEMAFRNREDLRRTYASMVSDWTGASIRFGSDEELIEDLVESGVLKEQK
jgi:hypothetical protein